MDLTPSQRKPQETTWLWFLKIIAGLLIVFLLGLHFIVNHFLGPAQGLLDYNAVIEYYNNPIIPIIEIVFLIVVVFHSLVGSRSIILDLHPSARTIKILDIVLIVLGSVAVIYGIWLVMIVVAK